MNNEPSITSKIVSLENFEDLNDNFVLRSPNKGKIFRGPNWNAFNRESLGSIPRKSENILFQEKISDVKKGFLSQSGRFGEYMKKESVKYSYPGPGNYSRESTLDRSVSTNPSISSKGYGIGFVSKLERFDDAKEFYDKYYPGPGFYKNATNSGFDKNLKKNMRYKSLYNSNEVSSIKISKEKPGPGFYNPINPTLLTKEMNDYKQHYFFASKDMRLKETHLEKERKSIPGPGKYFLKNENIILEPDRTSFFFKDNLPKRIDNIENHINTRKIKKFRVPGPGKYNLRIDLIDEKKLNLGYKKPMIDESQKMQEKIIEDEFEQMNLMSKHNRNIIIPLKSPIENSSKIIRSVFESKSPKNNYIQINHVPGPSYYNPQLWPSKISYNCNVEKTWI